MDASDSPQLRIVVVHKVAILFGRIMEPSLACSAHKGWLTTNRVVNTGPQRRRVAATWNSGRLAHSRDLKSRLERVLFHVSGSPKPVVRCDGACPAAAHLLLLQRRTEQTMREMTVREANQNFSKVIAAAEQGETILITKNGKPVARIAPQPVDRTRDPEWQSAYKALAKSLKAKRDTGFRLGKITEDDKYG
jgi:prevent-host-death family protein